MTLSSAWFRTSAIAAAVTVFAGCSDGATSGRSKGNGTGAMGSGVAGGNGGTSGGQGAMAGTGAMGASPSGAGGAAAGGGTMGEGGTTGTAGRGGTTGTSGATSSGGAPNGGASGSTGDGGTSGSAGASGGPSLTWPNAMSSANSDPWLAQNHDGISQLKPKVLVIDLENTANAAALVDRHIAALAESTSPHKFKDPTAQPALAYELVKIVEAPKGTGPTVNYNAWNTQSFADSNLKIPDPDDPSVNLTLCGLFEKGVINEVWCMASSTPKCGETQEAKQVYDANGNKVAGKFVSASNGDNITGLGCKVTARITDFNSSRGTGCHQHAMGHAWERYMDQGGAIPVLRKQAARFLNWDLNTRVGAPFPNFYSACITNGARLTDCMKWESNVHMVSGPSAAQSFDIADMSGGCGNAHFYPNTTGTYSYDANTPDDEVLCSCENYGLHNGPDGKDLTNTFTNAMTDTLYGKSPSRITDACPANQPACSDDCGGHGTAYLYQNFPGPGTKATNDDGTPMHNWWVYLFY